MLYFPRFIWESGEQGRSSVWEVSIRVVAFLVFVAVMVGLFVLVQYLPHRFKHVRLQRKFPGESMGYFDSCPFCRRT